MAVNVRGVSIPAVWAGNAQTTIPNPPVVGIGYRNTGVSTASIQGGQLYKSLGDSAAWNQYLYSLSSVAQAAEVYGIMPYSGSTTYKDMSMCLYTDRLLYRAKSDVPVGTPCTNTTYWDKYIPDGIQEAPPITATAGVVLYVDYTKSSSGNGLTLATAFRNLTDCFSAMRNKFAGANGAFKTAVWIPLFKVIVSGSGSVNVESGNWNIQNMSLELVFNTPTYIPGTIRIEQSVCKLSGPELLTVSGGLETWSSYVTIACSLNLRMIGLGFRASNIMIGPGNIDVLANTGLQSADSTIDVNSSVKIVSNSGPLPVLRGVNLAIGTSGSVTMDSTSTNTGLRLSVTGCIFVVSGTLGMRLPFCVGSSFLMTDGAIMKTGSNYATADYGFVLRGGYLFADAGLRIQNLGRNPNTKGVLAPGGTIDGVAQAVWPGSLPWTIVGNGYYQP